MESFLETSLSLILSKQTDLSQAIFVFPGKRSANAFKDKLVQSVFKTGFFPKILSIESFYEEVSGLTILPPTELLFRSYSSYLKTEAFSEKDDFLTFASWINTILNDFNEIDQYLAPVNSLFSYLKNIQEINHWSQQENKTPLITNFIKFWEALPFFYNQLREDLYQSSSGYQGMVSRKATEDIEHYIQQNSKTPHYFIGFNALTKAEELIIQELLETGNTTVLWDADSYFINDRQHSASTFMNKIFNRWKYYQTHRPQIIQSNYQEKKDITIVEALKSISQVKYIGNLIRSFSEEKRNKTVIVLADDKLLKPLLYSIPKDCDFNVTMGLPLKNLPLYEFFISIIKLQINYNHKKLYYKDVLTILNHPLITYFTKNAQEAVKNIHKNNYNYLSENLLLSLLNTTKTELTMLFSKWKNNDSINNVQQLINHLKKQPISNIDLATLFEFNNLMNTINRSLHKNTQSPSVLYQLLSDFAQTTKINFEGKSNKGIQIMGLLETRVLDFENVIIASVNEGILPSVVHRNSYLPYDVKKQFGLPLRFEKEQVFAYHFYRVLHRATDITLLYNGISDGLNTAEKSRFIYQIENEKIPNHTIKHIVLSPHIKINKQQPVTITKSQGVYQKLQKMATSGFSPSALIHYIRNPIDFYNTSILGVKEPDLLEEDIADSTFGTIVHDTLENLYRPLIGTPLTKESLLQLKEKINTEVTLRFSKYFPENSFKIGKNLLVLEVIKRYIANFISYEISDIEKGNTITILELERKLQTSIYVKELDLNITLKGKIDRLDRFNDELRIMDYKTGKVENSDLKIFDFNNLITDYKYSKSFQVLTYALMIYNTYGFQKAQAGIVSFKNLKSGFMPFGIKESPAPRSKTYPWVTKEVLEMFQEQLNALLVEIFNPEQPFVEKET